MCITLKDFFIAFTKYLVFQKALLKWHGICDCKLNLKRLSTDEFEPKPAKKKFLSAPKVNSVRSHVNWLPVLSAKPNEPLTLTTMHDFHSELLSKVNTLNRSLRPASERLIPDAKRNSVPQWKCIFDEFQAAAAASRKEKQYNN